MLEFSLYVLVGFLAQLIDGAMGMAYGLSCSTFLRSMGVPSLISTACIHIAEVFTTMFSGLAHLRLGNIDKSLFYRLSVSGVLGGLLGILALRYQLFPVLDQLIDVYLLIMGIYILSKAFQPRMMVPKPSQVPIIGFFGGFLDAVGGGGWGPIVTTHLLAQSPTPRTVIGSANAAEFFVTSLQTVFFLAYGLSDLQRYVTVIVGLMLGGLLAAPLAAYLVTKLKARQLFLIVGLVLIFLNIYSLVMS